MRKQSLRAVACIMAALMVLTTFGGTITAHAASEPTVLSETSSQEKTLTVTQSMVDPDGILIISGTWNRIIVPKEINVSTIFFKEIQVDVVEIESGLKSQIVMMSGTADEITVVPSKAKTMTIQELCDLIKEGNDPVAVLEQYYETKNKHDEYLNNRPTITTRSNMTISNVTVSGNAKLDLNSGTVANVKVDADGTQSELKVDISNYDGNISVAQTNNEDGKFTITWVNLKNSNVENLTVNGEGNGNVVLDGKKSNVAEVKVESSSMISLEVPSEKVEVAATATNVKLTILEQINDMSVAATDSQIEVGSCGTVTNATVEGTNVTISGTGTLTDVEIVGEDVAVSTPGTNVEGENAYVPPMVITPPSEPTTPPESGDSDVRDLGGLEIIIADHFTNPDRDPINPEEEALQAYREEMMKKHNFTIKQMAITDWGNLSSVFQTASALGSPIAQVYYLDYRFLTDNLHLFYDLSTLSELDFSEDKWNSSVTELMSYKGGIYGMSSYNSQETSSVNGIIFNKRLFEEAGLDPNLPYELQKNGEWTWSKFKEICAQLTRDTNNDGITDVYATCSQNSQMLTQLILSTGSQLFEVQNGRFVNNANSSEVLSALNYAQDLVDKGYELPQSESSEWNYYELAFPSGAAAMQFSQDYVLRSEQYATMEDELGFVCCPKADNATSYQVLSTPNVAVIPAFYDAETAADIAFAYNIWTNPAPEYAEDDWKTDYDDYELDEKIINETLALYFEDGLGVFPYSSLVTQSVSELLYWLFPFVDTTPEKVIQELLPTWNALVAEINAAKTPDIGFDCQLEDLTYALKLNYNGTLSVTKCTAPDSTELILPEKINGFTVTEIADRAFYEASLETLSLPDSLQRIGDSAFACCFGLTGDIVLPESVVEIGDTAFSACDNIQSIAIPAGVTSIGAWAFPSSEQFTLIVEQGSYADTYASDYGYAVEYK